MPLVSPKVRADLEYFPKVIEGREVVLVRDPIRGTYHRFNLLQAAMLRALDGVRTLPEIIETLSEEFETEIPVPALKRFLASAQKQLLLDVASYRVPAARATKRVFAELRRAGFRFRAPPRETEPLGAKTEEGVLFASGIRLLQHGDPATALDYFCAVLEINPNNERAKQIATAIQVGYVRALSGATTDWPAFPLFDPTNLLRVLDRTIGKVIFHRYNLILLILLLTLSIYIYATADHPRFDFDAVDVLLAYALLTAHSAVHELGHGLTCYHYGGSVREIGVFLFYYIGVDAYCDTSSTYLFDNQRHKLAVQAAGPLTSLVLSCFLMIFMALVRPDLSFYPALQITLFFTVFTVFASSVPFLKLDGYYALSDHLGIPNLRERSFAYLKAVLAKRLLGVDSEVESVSARHRKVFLWFGVLSFLFTVWWLPYTLVQVCTPIADKLPSASVGIMLLLLVYFLRGILIYPVLHVIALVIRQRRRVFVWPRTALPLSVLVLVLVALIVQRRVSVDSDFVLRPTESAELRADAAGEIVQVLVREGDVVEAHQPLVVMRNDALELQIRMREQRLAALDARQTSSPSGSLQAERAVAAAELDRLRVMRSQLTLSSPIRGVVTTDVEPLLHSWVHPGASVLEIQDTREFVAELRMSPSARLDDVAPGDAIRLRAEGVPGTEVECTVASIRESQTTPGAVITTTAFALPTGRTGMEGHARIYGREHSLAYSNLYVPVHRLFDIDLWSLL